MSNKNLDIHHKLTSELESIQPPDHLHQTIRSRIVRAETAKPVIRSKKKLTLVISFTCIILMIFGGGFVSPTFAGLLNKIPVIGILYKSYDSDIGLKEAKKKGLTESSQTSITSNNLKLTITNTYYDGNTLTFGYTLKHKGEDQWIIPKKRGNGGWNFLIKKHPNKVGIDGETVGISSSENYEVKGPKEIEGVVTLYPGKHNKEDLNLTMNLTQITGINGKWNFAIPITKDKTEEHVQSFSPNFKVKAFGGEIIVKKIDFTPTSLGLDTEAIMDKGIGSEIYFSIVGVGPDLGLTGHTEDLGNGKEKVVNHSPFPPIEQIPDSITITAYDSEDTSKKITFTVPLNN
jgi:hypothetical protein